MPRPDRDEATVRMSSLAHLYELARLDAQRPGNIGAGLNVLKALLNTGFRPKNGGQA